MQSALHQVVGPKEVLPETLDGRVAVVTGGALGIGYEVSRALAHAGCKVIMVNRSQDQGQEAIAEIQKETPAADVSWKECDLGNLFQVKSFFTELGETLERLDYLVLSAGINANQYGLDSDGIELYSRTGRSPRSCKHFCELMSFCQTQIVTIPILESRTNASGTGQHRHAGTV